MSKPGDAVVRTEAAPAWAPPNQVAPPGAAKHLGACGHSWSDEPPLSCFGTREGGAGELQER